MCWPCSLIHYLKHFAFINFFFFVLSLLQSIHNWVVKSQAFFSLLSRDSEAKEQRRLERFPRKHACRCSVLELAGTSRVHHTNTVNEMKEESDR